MSENEEQHPQSSDFPTTGYEAAEEEGRALKQDAEERNASVTEEQKEEELPPESATQHKRSERRRVGKRSRNNATTIATAATAWQITLIDLDKQLNKQSMLIERISDDIRHLRKQFNQVQRDLSKFEKRIQIMKTTRPSSSAKTGKRGG